MLLLYIVLIICRLTGLEPTVNFENQRHLQIGQLSVVYVRNTLFPRTMSNCVICDVLYSCYFLTNNV